MVEVTKVEIKESVQELHELLVKQKTASSRERIQALYLLKMGQVRTIQDAAFVVGRERVTVQRWLKTYTESGINGLLLTKKSPGRPPIIDGLVRERMARLFSYLLRQAL